MAKAPVIEPIAERCAHYTDNVAPGTVLLEDLTGTGLQHASDDHLVLWPQPTRDPNDPLNWTTRRKAVNFSITTLYTVLVFASLNISPVVWQDFNEQLGISYAQLNDCYATNCAALAIGCIVFIPFAHKYGRRSVYLITTLITFAVAIWQACLRDFGNMMATQVFAGLAGAVSDTLVQMTIADLYFVHQRGQMTAIYVLATTVGGFLAPIAAGYVAEAQGWPWIFWWCSIFLGVNLLIYIFCYEETKFIIGTVADSQTLPTLNNDVFKSATDPSIEHTEKVEQIISNDEARTQQLPESRIDHSIPLKSYRQRLALLTTSPGGIRKLVQHMYQPVLMLGMFPAVAYTALQYGAMLSWFSVVASTQSQYFSTEPYNFGTSGIGLLSIPPFIGAVFGYLWSGPLSDWSIIWIAKRNKGVYEPEMRLYITFVPALIGPAGLFLYGYSMSAGMPWIIPCIGTALYGVGIVAVPTLALTYLIDSYREILGDALVGVAFIRNLLAMIIVFALSPWIKGMGLHDASTLVGCLALLVNLLCIPMIIFGKRWRVACRARYERMALMQYDARAI